MIPLNSHLPVDLHLDQLYKAFSLWRPLNLRVLCLVGQRQFCDLMSMLLGLEFLNVLIKNLQLLFQIVGNLEANFLQTKVLRLLLVHDV